MRSQILRLYALNPKNPYKFEARTSNCCTNIQVEMLMQTCKNIFFFNDWNPIKMNEYP